MTWCGPGGRRSPERLDRASPRSGGDSADDVLRERVRSRAEQGQDASEADLPVLERQLAQAEPLAPQEQAAVLAINTAAPLDVDALAARWLAAA